MTNQAHGSNLKKKFLLIAVGSAGDVHPFIALGAELKRRGFAASLMATPWFKNKIEAHGLEFIPLGTEEDYLQGVRNKDIWNPRKGLKVAFDSGFNRTIRPIFNVVSQQDPANTIVVASTFAFGARIAQDKTGINLITVHLQPSALWSVERPAVIPALGDISGWPRWARRIFFGGIESLALDRMFGRVINEVRVENGLVPVQRIFRTWIHSPYKVLGLFPDWFAGRASDWPQHLSLTGFVRFDAGQQPEGLAEFISAGSKPLVFTPGTAYGNPQDFFAIAIRTARKLKKRAILISSHISKIDGLSPDDPEIKLVPYAPFSSILPQAAAFVHHGGIGTSAQGLAAGVPQLVQPFNFDQPDNARHLKALGVGDFLYPASFSVEKLSYVLQRLTESQDIKASCERWKHKIQFDFALQRACDLIVESEKATI